MARRRNKTYFLASLVFLFLFALILYAAYSMDVKSRMLLVDDFEKCRNAGYSVMESYPERCMRPDGVTFVNGKVEVLYEGEIVCLPHKNKKGPQTLECAYGLLSNGVYYSLAWTDTTQMMEVPFNRRVMVSGILTNSPENSIYEISGKIDVSKVELKENY